MTKSVQIPSRDSLKGLTEPFQLLPNCRRLIKRRGEGLSSGLESQGQCVFLASFFFPHYWAAAGFSTAEISPEIELTTFMT